MKVEKNNNLKMISQLEHKLNSTIEQNRAMSQSLLQAKKSVNGLDIST
jgi:hypothetical protein